MVIYSKFWRLLWRIYIRHTALSRKGNDSMDKEDCSNRFQTLHSITKELKIAKVMCRFSFIISVITMTMGIIVSCRFISNLEVRGIFISLLVIMGVSISSLMGILSKCNAICRENLKD